MDRSRRAGALVRRPRRPKPHWQRYAKALPGERAQMDLLYLPEGRFQGSPLSTTAAGSWLPPCLTQRTTGAVCEAVPRLLGSIPFPLHCIQTDNGSEFARAFSQVLAKQGIRHVRIRPRTPHLNGKVERVQRTMREEHWDGVVTGSVEDWERRLRAYVRFYNTKRLHSALGFSTPLMYALERLPQAHIYHIS